MPPFKVLSPELNYGRRDTINDLSKLAITYLMKNKEREEDKKESDRLAQLNLLAGELRDAKGDLRGLKADYEEKSILHETILGASPNKPEYTRAGIDLSGDIMQDYINTIESKQKEIDFYTAQGKNIVKELAAIDRLREGSKYIVKTYGDKNIYDLPDVENQVLSDHLGIDQNIIERYKEMNPWFGSQKWLDLKNLQEEDINWTKEVRSSARKKEAEGDERNVVSQASNTLGTSKFMNDMETLTASGIQDRELKEAVNLIGGKIVQGKKGSEIKGLRIVDALWKDLNEDEKFEKLSDLYSVFKTLKTGAGTPKNKIGINLFIKRWRKTRESLPSDFDKDTFDEWSEKFFNVSSKNIDNLYFDEYDPVTGTTKKSFYKNETVKSFLEDERKTYKHLSDNDFLKSRGKFIRALFESQPNYKIKKTQDVIDFLLSPDLIESWSTDGKHPDIHYRTPPKEKTADVGLSYPYKWDFDAYGGESEGELDILWKEHPEWHMTVGKDMSGTTQYQLMPQHYEEAYELLRSKKKE